MWYNASSHAVLTTKTVSSMSCLELFDLPALGVLLASDIAKIQWKSRCRRAIVEHWTRVYVNDIKTKKTFKYLSVAQLRVGCTHLSMAKCRDYI